MSRTALGDVSEHSERRENTGRTRGLRIFGHARRRTRQVIGVVGHRHVFGRANEQQVHQTQHLGHGRKHVYTGKSFETRVLVQIAREIER